MAQPWRAQFPAMAADSTTFVEGTAERRRPHPLALAYLALFAILILLGVGITFLGDSHADDPVVIVDLAKPHPSRPPL